MQPALSDAPQELVIASHNAGKIREIETLVAPLGFSVLSAGDLDLPEPEETGSDFETNAAIKSESACVLSGKPSLADDSGMAVMALDGAPGIYSARWAGPSKDFGYAMQRVHDAIAQKGIDPQGAAASFICVLAFSVPEQETVFFHGEVKGRLRFPPIGAHGFGYDPIFVPEGHSESFGQMVPMAKHAISHRAIAFAKFVEHLKTLR